MLLKYFIYIIFVNILLAKECSPYFNPVRFYETYESNIAFDNILQKNSLQAIKKEFDIVKKELYKYTPSEIANEINDDFGGFWSDIADADSYESYLLPEYTNFKYKNFYFSLKIYFYGLQGDATKLKTTTIKYHFYNYTNQVEKYIKCKKSQK